MRNLSVQKRKKDRLGGGRGQEMWFLGVGKICGLGIRLFFVRQTSEVVHAGVQRESKAFALFKAHVAFAALNF